MVGFTEVFGGQNIYPAQLTLLPLTLTADIVLQWPTEVALPGEDVFADIIDVTSDQANRVITFPDATIAGPGQSTLINNLGAFTVVVEDAGGNVIGSVPSGEVWQFYLQDNTTEEGEWATFEFGTGTSSAVAAALAGAGLKAITTTLNVQFTPRSDNASPLAIINSDRAKIVQWTGGAGAGTLPDPATVGADWFALIRNNGTGTWTITPAAGLINGVANLPLAPYGSAIVYSTGTAYYTVGLSQVTPTNFDFTAINVAGTGDYTLTGTELNRISYRLTGVLSGARNVVVPATVQQYWINNGTSGAFDLQVKTPAGLGVVVPQGTAMILYCDGTDVVASDGAPTTGLLPVLRGGTGLITIDQGDILFGSALNVYSRLSKDTNATRYLSNTGASNNPVWGQVNVANGITGRLPLANLAQGSALSVLGVAGNSVADEASIAASAANQVMRNNQFNTGIGWGPIRLDDNTNAVTNVLDETNGGTGQSTITQGDLLYGSAANVLSKLPKGTTGLMALFNTGATNNPAWLTPRFSVTAAANSDITFALTDAWSVIPHTGATPQAWTIPPNGTVAFDIGTAMILDNRLGAGAITLTPGAAVTLDGHGQSGVAGAGTFVLPPGYKLITWKVDTNTWAFLTDAPQTAATQVVYRGYVGSDGTTGNRLPAGWSASNIGGSVYRVVHNLALANGLDLSVATMVVNSSGNTNAYGSGAPGTNSFDVATVNAGSGAATDQAFSFVAGRNS